MNDDRALEAARDEYVEARAALDARTVKDGQFFWSGIQDRYDLAAHALAAALEARLAAADAELARTRAFTVLVTIVPEWQGNYAYEYNERLVIVNSRYEDKRQFYEVLGRAGKCWIDGEELRLAASAADVSTPDAPTDAPAEET